MSALVAPSILAANFSHLADEVHRAAKCGVGLSLNPATPFEAVEPFLPAIDLLLVMTVHPGFGGQAFRSEMMEKVKRATVWNKAHGTKFDIEVDGGINRSE